MANNSAVTRMLGPIKNIVAEHNEESCNDSDSNNKIQIIDAPNRVSKSMYHRSESTMKGTLTTAMGENADAKLKALSHEFRRLLLGLVYVNEGIHPSEMEKHVNVKSNLIAHHLNILVDAKLIRREYSRDGKSLVRYWIEEDGERFLEFIGAKEKLGKIKNSTFLEIT